MSPTPYVLADKADLLYQEGKDTELRELARSLWPPADGSSPVGVADVCRLAMVVCHRLANALPAEDPAAVALRAEAVLLEAHGLTAAALAGETNVVAGFLLPRFFRLAESNEFEKARQVLDDMLRLIKEHNDDDLVQRPFPRVLKRLEAEKRAYSFFAEERYADAIQFYERARGLALSSKRSLLKVRGGLALSKFMDSARGESDLSALKHELRDVMNEGKQSPYPDVVDWASKNLDLIETGRRDGWVPFEVP